MADGIKDSSEKSSRPVQRLCNEIQLFDLCEREKCRHKVGLFCTDEELLNRFEAIADIEDRPAEGLISEDSDDEGGSGECGYDDAFEDEEYPDGVDVDEDYQ
jgi:hypothetical protein